MLWLEKAGIAVNLHWLQNTYPHDAQIDWDLVKSHGEKLAQIPMTQVWSDAACD